MHLPGKLFIFVAMLEILLVADYSEGRYLPTRGHGDNLEKLRELMYQILESSDENQNDQQQRLAYARHPSWSKQSVLPDNDLPQLFGSSSKSRYSGGGGGGGANHGYDTERLYS